VPFPDGKGRHGIAATDAEKDGFFRMEGEETGRRISGDELRLCEDAGFVIKVRKVDTVRARADVNRLGQRMSDA
jgi:hypothetical protein